MGGRSRYNTQAWHAVSALVLRRDGYRCQIRGPGCTGRATTADHVIELQDGAPMYDMGNLQAACRRCNSAKGAQRKVQRDRQVRKW